MRMLTVGLLLAGWVGWALPFFLIKRSGRTPQKVDRRARWGIAVQGVAFALVWQAKWRIAPDAARVVVASACFALAITLSWGATRALGRQWRFDAGLNADHQLVRSGAYRLVRHPIYASMLCMLIGTGILLTRIRFLAVSVPLFIIGAEIRIRVEDALLASRFGDEFREYQRQVPAYLPFIR